VNFSNTSRIHFSANNTSFRPFKPMGLSAHRQQHIDTQTHKSEDSRSLANIKTSLQTGTKTESGGEETTLYGRHFHIRTGTAATGNAQSLIYVARLVVAHVPAGCMYVQTQRCLSYPHIFICTNFYFFGHTLLAMALCLCVTGRSNGQ